MCSSDLYTCWVSNGTITDTASSAGTATNIKVWNNTFYNTGTNVFGVIAGYSHNGSGNEFRNNIAVDLSGYVVSGTKSNNLWDNSSAASSDTDGQYWSSGYAALFTDADNDDFTLKVATDDGYDLNAYYTDDMLGIDYDVSGVWDRGAYAYPQSEEVPANAIQGVLISELKVTDNLTAWNRSDGLR